MAYLVGVVLAVVVCGFATIAGLDRDRAFYPTITIVIASYYGLFAVMGGACDSRESRAVFSEAGKDDQPQRVRPLAVVLVSEREPTAEELRGLLPRALENTGGDEAFEVADQRAKRGMFNDCQVINARVAENGDVSVHCDSRRMAWSTSS
jgi:hypothetical protein